MRNILWFARQLFMLIVVSAVLTAGCYGLFWLATHRPVVLLFVFFMMLFAPAAFDKKYMKKG